MIRIAIQAKGRLNEDSMELLAEAGMKIADSRRKLLTQAEGFPLEVLYLRDDDSFKALCLSKMDYEPFSLVEAVENGAIEERKAWKPYDKNGQMEKRAGKIEERWRTEHEIFSRLSPLYPELREYETIIDIPEPISFETDINILMPDGSIQKPAEDEMLFSRAGDIFSRSLRKVALYLPSYVNVRDAERVFLEVANG